MLEKPDVPDQLILSRLQAEYGLGITDVSFLPLGYDIHTAVYLVSTHDGATYFLKLRKNPFDPITVAVPHFLSNLGIRSVMAPLETQKGELYGSLIYKDDNIKLILYPYIHGTDGYQVELADQHWIELGQTLKKVHTTLIPPALATLIPHETYDSQWRDSVKRFLVQVEGVTFNDAVSEKLSAFIKSKRREINHMVIRVDELAESLCQQPVDFVLCHSDAHPGNYLIADNGDLFLVDWDNPIFAPNERDLMFFGSGMSGIQPGGREETLFYQGYGQVDVDQTALTYYRYERIIQDIAEFCKQILLTRAGGEDRLQSYKYLLSSFSPGKEVEAAFLTDQLSGIR